MAAEKPCPWHVDTIDVESRHSLTIYCEVGPAGHDGGHIGDRTMEDYYRLLREWRAEKERIKNGAA